MKYQNILIRARRNRLAAQESTRTQESTSFDNDCKFTYSFTAHMHEIPKYCLGGRMVNISCTCARKQIDKDFTYISIKTIHAHARETN